MGTQSVDLPSNASGSKCMVVGPSPQAIWSTLTSSLEPQLIAQAAPLPEELPSGKLTQLWKDTPFFMVQATKKTFFNGYAIHSQGVLDLAMKMKILREPLWFTTQTDKPGMGPQHSVASSLWSLVGITIIHWLYKPRNITGGVPHNVGDPLVNVHPKSVDASAFTGGPRPSLRTALRTGFPAHLRWSHPIYKHNQAARGISYHCCIEIQGALW